MALLSAGARCAFVSLTLFARPVEAATPPEPSRTPWVSETAIAKLEQALADYTKAAKSGGWPQLPEKVSLKPGDTNANVKILRRRLEVTGDTVATSRADALFDDELREAVARYQARNGFEPTGVINGAVVKALNAPADLRADQIKVNLARMRELLPKLAAAPKYIVMNGANFEVQGITGNEVQVASRVVSGKRATPTPLISATVRSINILPFWHVPPGIARRNVIPAARKSVSYFYKEQIRVFSNFGGEEIDPSQVNWFGPEANRYSFRQQPGPKNALGVMRFDMPNDKLVYMHDSPNKELYLKFERAFSSGCVRTQNFYEVADWLLKGQDGWTRQGLEAAVASGKQRTIKLANPVPVYFTYLTAWVDNRVVHFRNDLYDRDKRELDKHEASGAVAGREAPPPDAFYDWDTTVTPVAQVEKPKFSPASLSGALDRGLTTLDTGEDPTARPFSLPVAP